MSEPFDFDAAIAEVESATKPVIINGDTVQVKTSVPLIATTYLNQGNYLAFLTTIMPEDAARYVAERIPDNADGAKIINRFLRKEVGVDLGESEASAGS